MLVNMVLVLCLIYLTLAPFYFFFRVFEERLRREKLRHILKQLNEAMQKLQEDKEDRE